MSLLSVRCLLFFIAFQTTCCQEIAGQSIRSGNEKITFRDDLSGKKVDVLVGGELFTSYRWPDNVYKPVLFPIIAAGGTIITRGFPLEPREGERDDHRHQVGNWLNYGNVNGFDFWGNGHTGERLPNGGEIRHNTFDGKSYEASKGILKTNASWLGPGGRELLKEKTEFHFIARGPVRIIDRLTSLTATEEVTFKDTKEGMFAVRVARQLELPSSEGATGSSIGKATGNYRSSEGVTGDNVWGTRAKWLNLYGSIDSQDISLIICDHPRNPNYPTWWHARGYGLFSANPLGARDFTGGKEEINFSLEKGQSVTFRYRIIIASGKHLSDQEINKLAEEFTSKF